MKRAVLPLASHPEGYRLTPEIEPLPPAQPGERIEIHADIGDDFEPEQLVIKQGMGHHGHQDRQRVADLEVVARPSRSKP